MQIFRRGRSKDIRGTTALEFALILAPLLALFLSVFELSFDLFIQSALDSGLQLAARQIQTGNAQNAKSGSDFINNYLCPDIGTLLACGGLYIRVQRISPTSTQDYYDYTTGTPPVTAGALVLSAYNGTASFCNSGPSQMLLISAVYVAPSLLGSLLSNGRAVTYNGQFVHATLSTIGLVTESYSSAGASSGAASPC